MFVWFRGDARRAIARSQEFAGELMHDHVGTQHLLLGLLARPNPIAALALADLGLTLDGVRCAVVERCGTGTAMRAGHVPFTSRMWRAVEFAAAGSQFQYVGPADLLLALLEEPESTACQILTDQVGELSRVRGAVAQRRAAGPDPSAEHRHAFSTVFFSSERSEGQLLVVHNRLTGLARMVDALSHHMAREFMHDHRGTQHLLLGLLARSDELNSSFPAELTRTHAPATSMYPTIAELALTDLGMSLNGVRRAVVERCGIGAVMPDDYIAPTTRRQRVFERSLTTAGSLHHDRIGPEHLLLALLEEPESTGYQILSDQVGDLSRVRGAVLERLRAVQQQLAAEPQVEAEASQSRSETTAGHLSDGHAIDHRPPRPAASTQPARWLIDRVSLSSQHWVARSVGSGFPAYARLLHPVDDHPNSPLWAQVARTNRRTLHPSVWWEQISSPASAEANKVALAVVWRAEQSGHMWPGDPRRGLRTWALEQLCAVLARHTATQQPCYFAVRTDGQPIVFPSMTASSPSASQPAAPAPDEWQLDKTGPTFVLPDAGGAPYSPSLPDSLPLPAALPQPFHPVSQRHYYYLLEGRPGAAVRIGRWADERSFYHQSPSFIWPADHNWLVAITSDSDSTIIGGSRQLIEELCASEAIEVLQIAPDDDLVLHRLDAGHPNQ